MPAGRPKLDDSQKKAYRQKLRTHLHDPGKGPEDLPDIWLPNPPGRKGTSAYAEWAKMAFIELIKSGYNYSQAAKYLGYKGYSWVEQTRGRDPVWWDEVQEALKGPQKFQAPDLSKMSFEEFVNVYLGIEFAQHQRDIAKVLEDPRGKLCLILGHPESGKSTMISLWWPLYKIAQDQDIRIALVSKSSAKAQDLLLRVKRYLTEDQLYEDSPRNLIEDFGGFRPVHGELEWSADQVFVKQRTSGERDPTIQALGIGKQIYGTRLDQLILDDSLVLDNQISELQRDRLDNWFTSEARSRAQRGKTIVNGTRLFPLDLYGQWKKSWKDHPLYRQAIIPAIQDEWTPEERPSWPEYWTMDGYDILDTHEGEEIVVGYQQGLRDIRAEVMARDPDRWRLVYQQEDVEETEAVFRRSHIDNAFEIGAHRSLGQVFPGEILILGVDPATTGRAASVLLAIDPSTRIRTVVDIFVGSRLGASGIRQKLFYQFWDKYKEHGIAFTVVETNFAPTLFGDETFLDRAEAAGTRLVKHTTVGKGNKRGSKWDEEYGIGALNLLFSGGLMAFPSKLPSDRDAMQPLIDDMLVFPYAEQAQDALVALWVANGEAQTPTPRLVDQRVVFQRRGVPTAVLRSRGLAG